MTSGLCRECCRDGQPKAEVSVAAELQFLLRAGRRGGPVAVTCDGVSSLGHVVESLGVPLTEVGTMTVNGQPAARSYRPGDGDLIQVDAVRRPQRLGLGRFILDVHLGTLARRLRLIGVDAAYSNDAADEALVEQANAGAPGATDAGSRPAVPAQAAHGRLRTRRAAG